MNRGKKIVFVPIVEDIATLHQLMARAAFYLEFLLPGEIVIGVSDQALEEAAFVLPPELDEQAQAAVERLIDIFKIRRTTIHGMVTDLTEADTVFRWDASTTEAGPWKSLLRRSEIKAWGVDRFANRMEGSIYIQAAHEASDGSYDAIQTSKKRFEALAIRLGQHERAYVLATGPSIGAYQDHDFSDGLVIACNTVILDELLMKSTDPDVVVFGDPIFHFGCSQYAAEFRAALAKRAAEFDFTIVIPLKYYEHFLSLMPALAERTIGIPLGGQQFNLNLRSEFRVRTTENIATLLMIPLATTFAREVMFLGFDGRGSGETYFWNHGTKTQLSDYHMTNIKAAHPSFFNVDYEDYYSNHTVSMERMLWLGETAGHRFKSLEPSFIPALRRRSSQRQSTQLTEQAQIESAYTLLSINPDLENRFGHYYHFDERLRVAAATHGGRVITLANRAWTGADPAIIPWFTDHSWAPLREDPGQSRVRFREEIAAAFTAVAELEGAPPVGAFMYTGSYAHLLELIDAGLSSDTEPMPTAVNLFTAHKEVQDLESSATSAIPITGIVVNSNRNILETLGITVFGDTEKLNLLMREQTGIDLPLWPMFSTTDLPPIPESKERGKTLRVYAPGNLQLEKGYDLVARLAERLSGIDLGKKVTLVVRAVFHAGTPKNMKGLADQLRRHATVLDGELSDDDYIKELMNADIILVPYRRRPFETRTSAVISDAVSLGIPLIATRDTWGGDIVQQYQLGTTFEDGNVEDLIASLESLVRNYERYLERSREVASTWRADATPDHLLAKLLETTIQVRKFEHLDRPTLLSEFNRSRKLTALLESARALPVSAVSGITTDRTLVERNEKLKARVHRLEGQLKATKGSTAYRLAHRLVRTARRVPFLYRALKKIRGGTEPDQTQLVTTHRS